jgi:hypothetical protein
MIPVPIVVVEAAVEAPRDVIVVMDSLVMVAAPVLVAVVVGWNVLTAYSILSGP